MRTIKQQRGVAFQGICVVLLALMCVAVSPPSAAAETAEPNPLEQRERLLEIFRQDPGQAVPALEQALDDEAPFVRRTAAHLLVRVGQTARPKLETALGNDDFEVRIIAIRGLADMGLLAHYAGTMLQDGNYSVRRVVRMLLEDHPIPEGEGLEAFVGKLREMYREAPEAARLDAVQLLAALAEPGEQGRELLAKASADESPEVRLAAFGRLFELVDRESEEGRKVFAAAKQDESLEIQEKAHAAAGTYDDAEARESAFQAAHDRRAAQYLDEADLRGTETHRLPAEGWRFRLDRTRSGHEKGWQRPGFDDGDWQEAETEQFWHEFLGYQYAGVGWYRRTFEAPETGPLSKAYLHFAGVDESAWVWLNGEYAGHHHIGSAGWGVAFYLDVSDLLRPGEANHLAVRAMNTAMAGGVWRPVRLVVKEGD